MPRVARFSPGGLVYHVLNRAVARLPLFRKEEDWRWSSLWVRRRGDEELKSLLSDWPLDRPRNWVQTVNAAWTTKEMQALRMCMVRNRPFGNPAWQQATATKLGLLHTMRSEGRPKKRNEKQDPPEN